MARPVRFTFIMALATLAIALAAAGGWQFARASAPVSGPIILISVDSLRADHLPAYGYARGRTPALDALAKGGVVFERAYTHAPQTMPAHASLLTGRLPFETGVRDDVGFRLASSVPTLAEMLQARDFATGAVVSSFLLRRGTGIERGFDFFDDAVPPEQLGRPLDQIERDGAESEAIAERWLEAQDSSRAFLFLQLNEPHAPYAPPSEYSALDPYDGEVAYADAIIGRLVHALKAHQLYDRSTIIVTSDHGEGLEDHGEQEHGLFVYDEDIHVPLIVKPASGEGAGRRSSDLVQLADIMPTVLDLAKAPRPDDLDGLSLTSVIEGEEDLPKRLAYAEALYGDHMFGWAPLVSVTDGRWQYIQAPREELYDLATDTHERHNLAGADSADLSAFRQAANRMSTRWPGGKPQARPDELDPLVAASYGSMRLSRAPAARDAEPIDPKDVSGELDRYRAALSAASSRDWGAAIDLLQRLQRGDPDQPNLWFDLASIARRSGRVDLAVTAFGRVAALLPDDPSAALDVARAQLAARRFDAARARAQAALAMTDQTSQTRWSARALLVEIALSVHDGDAAEREASAAESIRPDFPLLDFTEGRVLASQGLYEQAAKRFDAGLPRLPGDGPRLPGLRMSAAETFMKLERDEDAEKQLLAELQDFPENIRARGELAQLYQATDRSESAARVLTDLLAFVPTPDAYSLAARLWTSFGDRGKADAVRNEARARTTARSLEH